MPKNKAKDSNIALTGLMGSGKSTIGRHLAHMLKKKFVDSDELIEEQESKTINQIFAEVGEDGFRKIEAQIIKKILEEDNQVISLGGGAVVNPKQRALIKDSASLVSLIASPQELYDRVKRRKNRPLLKDTDQLAKLEELWKIRKPAYYDSHLQIETESKTIGAITIEIMKKLGLKKVKTTELIVEINRNKVAYPIVFRELNKLDLTKLNPKGQVLIVSQPNIAKLYLKEIKDKLSQNHKVHSMLIDDGEDAKNFVTYQLILQKLLSLGFERKDTLIALGGGVVGDLVGFAASTYYRGIHYVQIPTTLLSMIDSSVGGKTAVNVAEGKNLIGSFYQPHLVHIDVSTLDSLPEREFRSGLGELIKYALLGYDWDHLIGDGFFEYIKVHSDEIINKDRDALIDVIEHSLRIKSGIVSQDETEKGIRAHLNLGHTFAHAIEELTKYQRYSHGEAVAIGIVCAMYMAEELQVFKPKYTTKVLELMQKLKLEYKVPKDIKTKDIISSFKYDKKVEFGNLRYIVPKASLGKVDIVSNVDLDLVRNAIDRNR